MPTELTPRSTDQTATVRELDRELARLLREPGGQSTVDVHTLPRLSGRIDRYGVIDGPVPIYAFYRASPSLGPVRDLEQTWSREAFDEVFAQLKYYENGFEFDASLGRPSRLSRFHFDRVKRKLLDWIVPAPQHRVLDVGCGVGYFLLLIREVYRRLGHDPQLVGIDASLVQLQFMTARFAKENTHGVLPVFGNAEHLPFADESFDLVTCSEVLEHIEDPDRALREIFRVLKPGGTLLLSTPSKLNEDLWDIILAPIVAVGKKFSVNKRGTAVQREAYDVPWYPGELRRAIHGAGLEIEHFEETGLIPHPYYFNWVPQFLMNPVLWGFETADRHLARHLPALAAHLLVRARKPLLKTGSTRKRVETMA